MSEARGGDATGCALLILAVIVFVLCMVVLAVLNACGVRVRI